MKLDSLGAQLELSSRELSSPTPRSMTNSQACAGRAVQRRRHERWFVKARAMLQVWGRRTRQRTEPAELSECERSGIGVSEADVWAESERRFWQE